MIRPTESRNRVGVWSEEELRALAARQYGLLHRAQLMGAGVTDNDVSRRLRRGRLEAVHAGVFYVDSTPRSWRTDVLAGVLAAGVDTTASHRCAAVLWDFDAVFGRVIEVTVPYVASPEPKGVIVHRTRRVNSITVRDEIPTTSPEKTLLDIAGIIPRRTLAKTMRSALLIGLTTPRRLDTAVGVEECPEPGR